MGREISCEIALKKGVKRDRAGGEPKQQQAGAAKQKYPETLGSGTAPAPNSESTALSKSVVSTTKAQAVKEIKRAKTSLSSDEKGCSTAAPENETEPTHEEQPKPAADQWKEAGKDNDSAEKPETKAQTRTAGRAAGEGEGGEGDENTKGGGLSKREARKAARKDLKKELKRKAKERAKKKKEDQAQEREDADAAKPDGVAGSLEGENNTSTTEVGDEVPLDPKAAKLLRDSRTVLIFGVADDLTPKQLQKRVKKASVYQMCS